MLIYIPLINQTALLALVKFTIVQIVAKFVSYLFVEEPEALS